MFVDVSCRAFFIGNSYRVLTAVMNASQALFAMVKKCGSLFDLDIVDGANPLTDFTPVALLIHDEFRIRFSMGGSIIKLKKIGAEPCEKSGFFDVSGSRGNISDDFRYIIIDILSWRLCFLFVHIEDGQVVVDHEDLIEVGELHAIFSGCS